MNHHIFHFQNNKIHEVLGIWKQLNQKQFRIDTHCGLALSFKSLHENTFETLWVKKPNQFKKSSPFLSNSLVLLEDKQMV